MFSVFIICTLFLSCTAKILPIVLWHGGFEFGGDVFDFYIETMIRQKIPDAYIVSIRLGNNIVDDFARSVLWNANDQIDYANKMLVNDPKLKNGYNAIGFSLGGILLRGLAQRYSTPPMKTLISIGGPQQGLGNLPLCPQISQNGCNMMRSFLSSILYTGFMQKHFIVANMWHDSSRENDYLANNTFLPDINNENSLNTTYKKNLLKLEKFVMTKFVNDSIVEPKESEWFEFYEPGQNKSILPLDKSPLYKEDRLGLKQMKKENKLEFLPVDGVHFSVLPEWFIPKIVERYLAKSH